MALGANPITIAWPEAYQALSQGLAEAVEVPISSAYSAKLMEVCKYYSFLKYLVVTDGIFISEKTFSSRLNAQDQKMVKEAAIKAMDFYSELETKMKEKNIKSMMNDYGVNFIHLSQKPWRKKVNDSGLAKKLIAQGIIEKNFMQSLLKVVDETKEK